ncbi:MAG TPA: DUF2272 domain-containing protein [Vicinamibacterales bacterium]|nr:DUF2272 domain-containing protein [Vicinamibacterales bacterium]
MIRTHRPFSWGTMALVIGVTLVTPTMAFTQQRPVERLPRTQLDVLAPSARVSGAPGAMTVRHTTCRTLPDAEIRRRLVEVAVQEWAFFGFATMEQTPRDPSREPPRRPRTFRWLDVEESARVAATIAGYWTATPEGAWILADQNEEWNGPDGVGSRWRYPWSAAFLSWVMCEGGLGDTARFKRAVAHHAYIDQAIAARAASEPSAAFAAYDIGEAAIEPGDLLCSGRRPGYQTIADRRRQTANGARTHCDLVVKLDDRGSRILAIGGNVRGVVSLKRMPAVRDANGRLRPAISPDRGGVFAHLKLRAPSIEPDAFDRSLTVQAAPKMVLGP